MIFRPARRNLKNPINEFSTLISRFPETCKSFRNEPRDLENLKRCENLRARLSLNEALRRVAWIGIDNFQDNSKLEKKCLGHKFETYKSSDLEGHTGSRLVVNNVARYSTKGAQLQFFSSIQQITEREHARREFPSLETRSSFVHKLHVLR